MVDLTVDRVFERGPPSSAAYPGTFLAASRPPLWYTERVTTPPPPGGPPTGPAQHPALTAIPLLQAPLWERQPGESDVEAAAFRGWLLGGTQLRDWTAACHASGMAPSAIQVTARRWAWEIRATEYQAHVRSVQLAASADMRTQLEAITRARLDNARQLVELVRLELGKLLQTSQKTDASVLEPRTLARLVAVLIPDVAALQRQADGLPPDVGDPSSGATWDRLSPAELEQMRQLRDKAAGR